MQEEYRSTLTLLQVLSLQYGFEYLCLWQPTIFLEEQLVGEEEVDRAYDDEALFYLSRAVDAGMKTEPDLGFYNISDCLGDRTVDYFYDEVHISEEGNAVVAARILEILASDVIAPPWTDDER